jgi:hypothetical protein
MLRKCAHLPTESDRPVLVVRPLAQIVVGLLVLSFAACGSTRSADNGDSSDDAGSAGAARGGASGGTASGGTASGGTASGGTASGGTSSGGSGGVNGVVTVCPGTPPPSGTYPPCRRQLDCTNGGFCQANAPSGEGLCGACFPPAAQCVSDADCADAAVCVTAPKMPCQCMGPGTVCAPACTAESCGDAEVCAASGHCVPASCTDDGYACAVGTVCDPARAGDAHGCTPALCDGDGYACSAESVCDAARAGDSHHCAPRQCDTEGYTCPEAMVCEPEGNVNEHGCRPLHCSEGFECPPNHDCNPATAVPNGCVRRSCASDAECDCGACVMEHCQDRLFMCVILPA